MGAPGGAHLRPPGRVGDEPAQALHQPVDVALRYLGSKKRAFISVGTAFAILGVALGVAALATVMSVTGGFQAQFRDKVLGVNAHVLVLKYSTDFREYRTLFGPEVGYDFMLTDLITMRPHLGVGVMRLSSRTVVQGQAVDDSKWTYYVAPSLLAVKHFGRIFDGARLFESCAGLDLIEEAHIDATSYRKQVRPDLLTDPELVRRIAEQALQPLIPD